MRLHIIATYFREYRQQFYQHFASDSVLHGDAIVEQLISRRLDWISDLCREGTGLGVKVTVSIVNDPISQVMWALNNQDRFTKRVRATLAGYLDGFTSNNFLGPSCLHWKSEDAELVDEIALQQAVSYEPDATLFLNAMYPRPHIREALRSRNIKNAVQCSYWTPDFSSLRNADLVLTVLDSFYHRFASVDLPVRQFFYGFNPQILEKHGMPPEHEDVCFVGQLGPRHYLRTRVFDTVARVLPFRWFGPQIDFNDAPTSLKKAYCGEAFGETMNVEMSKSAILINGNTDFAYFDFGNIRTFEIAGLGRVPVTPACIRYFSGFVPERNLLVYHNPDEALMQCIRLLSNRSLAETMGKAAQEVILEQYTTRMAVQQMLSLIASLL